VNEYPITTVKDSKNGDLAQAFVDLVLGSQGQSVLAEAGFAKP
jgi:molybdate transport system substrate-binding protein